MNNEPVAWMELYYGEPNNIAWTNAELKDSGEIYKTVPLYTHPSKHDLGIAEAIGFDKGHEAGRQLGMRQERALWELSASTQEIENPHPAKTLTDEEIVRISETCDLNHVLGLIDFARAILKKASEK
jgi:hypothetical protein